MKIVHPDYTELLYKNTNSRVTVTKEQLTNFVANSMNRRGQPRISVDGEVREVKWTSLGAGFYEIYTVQLTNPCPIPSCSNINH